MENRRLTGEELHELGIKWVYKHIKEEYNVLNVNIDMDKNPQILAKKEEQLYFIVIKTSTYPDVGWLTPTAAEEIIQHATKHNAKILFASVGIANADATSDEAMQHPQKNGHYYFNYTGLSVEPNLLIVPNSN